MTEDTNGEDGQRDHGAGPVTGAATVESVQDLVSKPSLGKDEMRRVLVWADEKATDQQRVEVLGALAPRIPRELLPLALRAMSKVQDPAALNGPLRALSRKLAPDLGTRVARVLTDWRSGIGWTISILILAAATAGLVWLCWFNWGADLWAWGDRSAGTRALSLAGWLYLGVAPLLPAYGIVPATEFWLSLGELSESQRARDAQERIENELLQTDEKRLQPLILLLRYSRQMLSEYYAIAQSQAQRSFRYCLIAMWIGFTILIAGVLGVVEPLRETLVSSVRAATTESPASNGAAPSSAASGDANKSTASKNPSTAPRDSGELVLLTGGIMEFIAAAFLWVYRFSINQQTYYYRRQFRVHNALLAHRLSEAMQSRDDATKTIVERLLEDIEAREVPAPGSGGFAALLKRG